MPIPAWKVDLIARALAQRGVDAPPLRAAAGWRAWASGAVSISCCAGRAGACLRASTSVRARASSMSASASSPGRRLARFWSPCGRPLHRSCRMAAAADAVVNETRQRHRPAAAAAQAPGPVAGAARGAGGAGRARRPGAAELGRPGIGRAGRRASHAAASVRRGARRPATRGLPAGHASGAEQAMRAAVAEWVGDAPRLADLFAGVGALSLGRPSKVALFESDKPAVTAAEAAARRLGGRSDRRARAICSAIR